MSHGIVARYEHRRGHGNEQKHGNERKLLRSEGEGCQCRGQVSKNPLRSGGSTSQTFLISSRHDCDGMRRGLRAGVLRELHRSPLANAVHQGECAIIGSTRLTAAREIHRNFKSSLELGAERRAEHPQVEITGQWQLNLNSEEGQTKVGASSRRLNPPARVRAQDSA